MKNKIYLTLKGRRGRSTNIRIRMQHELKTWPKFFQMIVQGEKNAEVRKDDRDFQNGDVLWLREYNPEMGKYTGFEAKVDVISVLRNVAGIKKGYCVICIKQRVGQIKDFVCANAGKKPKRNAA